MNEFEKHFENKGWKILDKCKYHEKFSGFITGFSSLDFSLFHDNTLYLLELKDFLDENNLKHEKIDFSDKTKIDKLKNDIKKKIIGSLLLHNPKYKTIECFYENSQNYLNIEIYIIFKIETKEIHNLTNLLKSLQPSFEEYKLIFGVRKIILSDYESLKNKNEFFINYF